MTDPTPKKRRVSARGSKQKGDNYEREIAAYLSEATGLRVERAPLSGGGVLGQGACGGADLLGAAGVHIEAKRTERFSPYPAMEQAERALRASGGPEAPVVVNRRNRMTTADSLVTMRLSFFVDLYTAWLLRHGYIKDTP